MNVTKLVVLILLVLQTTTLVLVLRYSRSKPIDGPRFLNSTVVMIAEMVKLLCCISIIFKSNAFNMKLSITELKREVISKPIETMKIAIPSGCYAVQNNLLFIALSYLDAPTYQVSYQLKILSSAIFSVVLLRRKLSSLKWVALFMLMAGVALVQIPSGDYEEKNPVYRWYGLGAILLSCVSSGFAGVYFEKLLKRSNQTLWIRNVQMAMFGSFFSAVAVYCSDFDKVREDGFFQGYDSITWFVIVLHAIGGLLVSSVIKYADNITKGFAASLSIIISSAVSYFLFSEFHPSPYFALGAVIVLSSTLLYGVPS